MKQPSECAAEREGIHRLLSLQQAVAKSQESSCCIQEECTSRKQMKSTGDDEVDQLIAECMAVMDDAPINTENPADPQSLKEALARPDVVQWIAGGDDKFIPSIRW